MFPGGGRPHTGRMRKSPWLAFALFLAFCCDASGADARKLLLAATEYPPYYSESLPLGGPVTEITVQALRRSGHEVEVVFLPWARALRLGELGAVDGLVGVWHSPPRDASFLFSQPVASNHVVLCKMKGRPPERFTSFEALRPYTVGVVLGYADPPGLAAAGVTTESVSDDLHNLRKLAAGHVDLVLIDNRVERYLARRNFADGGKAIECLQPPVQDIPQHLAVSRHSADAAELVAAFDEQLKRMLESGEFQEIAGKWGF